MARCRKHDQRLEDGVCPFCQYQENRRKEKAGITLEENKPVVFYPVDRIYPYKRTKKRGEPGVGVEDAVLGRPPLCQTCWEPKRGQGESGPYCKLCETPKAR